MIYMLVLAILGFIAGFLIMKLYLNMSMGQCIAFGLLNAFSGFCFGLTIALHAKILPNCDLWHCWTQLPDTKIENIKD